MTDGDKPAEMLSLMFSRGARAPEEVDVLARVCRGGKSKMAKVLLEQEIIQNPRWTCTVQGDFEYLHAACAVSGVSESSASDLVRLLVEAGADPALVDHRSGNTALHVAARNGNVHLFQFLVESGCPVDSVNDRGETPLYVLCDKHPSRPDGAELLLKLGADKDTAKELAKTNQKDAIVVALEK